MTTQAMDVPIRIIVGILFDILMVDEISLYVAGIVVVVVVVIYNKKLCVFFEFIYFQVPVQLLLDSFSAPYCLGRLIGILCFWYVENATT